VVSSGEQRLYGGIGRLRQQTRIENISNTLATEYIRNPRIEIAVKEWSVTSQAGLDGDHT
jgi:hypothetical protein